ncbi:hypothetical protein [Cupriavidus pinatubonensis]|uniref:hypothetical protein n=1 Tax=Cupriavidus pinatubonensis TaxID=248026 RepID=UPI00112C6110|nr:hypothetical protein [Cupriavidus pinatubonensis]TPQ31389.1 hypothetical protein C2U69_29030 [Cupriavidus pinatubonensis]
MTLEVDIQAELDEYYTRSLDNARDGFDKHLDTLSAPFLLKVTEAYLNAPVGVMFVGKETNGWYGKLREYYELPDGLEVLKARYLVQFSRPTGTSAFLTRTRFLAAEFAGGNRLTICWNNLMKMDWYRPGRGYSRTSINHSQELFDFSVAAVRFEIELLKPDLIIFGSGHKYDRALKEVLPERQTHFVEPRALWHFSANGIECYRTFHPGARDSSAPCPIADYYGDIVARAKATFKARITGW